MNASNGKCVSFVNGIVQYVYGTDSFLTNEGSIAVVAAAFAEKTQHRSYFRESQGIPLNCHRRLSTLTSVTLVNPHKCTVYHNVDSRKRNGLS